MLFSLKLGFINFFRALGEIGKIAWKWSKTLKNARFWSKTTQNGSKTRKRSKKGKKACFLTFLAFFRQKVLYGADALFWGFSKSAKMAKILVLDRLFWHFWLKPYFWPFLDFYRSDFDRFWVIFDRFWVILGRFWSFLVVFGCFLGYFFLKKSKKGLPPSIFRVFFEKKGKNRGRNPFFGVSDPFFPVLDSKKG